MPHVIIEHTSNLSDFIKSNQITEKLHKAVIDSGLFSPSAIKSRSYPTDDFIIGEYPYKQSSFIHITIYLLEGRTNEQKQILTKAIIEKISSYKEEIGKFSIDIRDMNKDIYIKDL